MCSLALGGQCVCDPGYSGTFCDTQPRGSMSCETNEDCGNGIGGICVPTTHTCECYKGWTCPSCDKVGDTCNAVAMIRGGGTCSSNKDCGNFGPDYDNPEHTGGECRGGICVCFEGYTCPHCTTGGNPESVVKGDLQCKDGSVTSVVTTSLLLVVLWITFVMMSCVCGKQEHTRMYRSISSFPKGVTTITRFFTSLYTM